MRQLRSRESSNSSKDTGLVVKVKVTQLYLTLSDPMGYTVRGILQARILEWVAFLFCRGSSQPRDRTQVSHIAGGLFTSWVTRKAQEYWLGSLSLLQWIFLTQEPNRGLLHCRQILYLLSYQEAHPINISPAKPSFHSLNLLLFFISDKNI